jgi:hypothetical protein
LLPAAALLFAQLATTVPHAGISRAPSALKIDGRLDDAAWAASRPFEDFTQKFPNEHAAPSGRTTFRVLFDDDSLYFGVVCEQTVPVIGRLTRRDRVIEADRVSISLDTRGDGRSAYEFTVNAAGVLSDMIRFNDTENDPDWDETWDARVQQTDRGWTAEIRIPLRILRFSGALGSSWGLEVRRYVSALQETDEWSFIPRAGGGEVSRYGRLDGVDQIRPAGLVELRPFVLARADRSDPGTETLRTGTAASFSAGLDAKWHARSDLTLDLALLPDFAQVEADQLILNLTNEEVQLPEKRPFFFEGRDVFATPLPLLYTRRIGRIAPSAPVVRGGEALYDPTAPARLLGATKLTGRLAEGLNVGSLAAFTNENDVTVQEPDGTRVARPVEPRTLFQALRLRKELPGNATVGLFTSSVIRGEDTVKYPRAGELAGLGPLKHAATLCPDGTQVVGGGRCTHDAYVGAVDGRWRSENGDWSASGQVLGTEIRQGPPRIARDGTVVQSGDVGLGGTASLAKEGGVPWVGDVSYTGSSRKLDYNDLGYMKRANIHSFGADLEYRTLEPWFVTNETHSRLELYGRTNTDDLVLAHGYQVNTKFKFTNFWEVFVEAHYRGRHFDDREVGDGTALERRELLGLEIELKTDPRKSVVGELSTTTQRIFDGWAADWTANALFRALPQLDFELGPEVVYASGEPRFTTRTDDALVFGKLRATEFSMTARGTYTFTPRISLQAYAQVFFAAGHYSDFGAFPAAQAGRGAVVHRSELLPTTAPTTNPDFQDAALNTNVVLRWEYTLGSTLFLVYTRSQSPRIDLVPGQRGEIDLGALRKAPATDTLLIKVTYFFG